MLIIHWYAFLKKNQVSQNEFKIVIRLFDMNVLWLIKEILKHEFVYINGLK